jgi:hypothetical protein
MLRYCILAIHRLKIRPTSAVFILAQLVKWQEMAEIAEKAETIFDIGVRKIISAFMNRGD